MYGQEISVSNFMELCLGLVVSEIKILLHAHTHTPYFLKTLLIKVVQFVQTWTWTFRFSWFWSCVVGLPVPYISKDHSATILEVKQFKTIYLGPLDPLIWRHSDPPFELSDPQHKPHHTLSHLTHLNCHNSAVRTSRFMYVSVFFISLRHFIIYDLVVGNTAQLGMLLLCGW
jgi:hypothetical protein